MLADLLLSIKVYMEIETSFVQKPASFCCFSTRVTYISSVVYLRCYSGQLLMSRSRNPRQRDPIWAGFLDWFHCIIWMWFRVQAQSRGATSVWEEPLVEPPFAHVWWWVRKRWKLWIQGYINSLQLQSGPKFYFTKLYSLENRSGKEEEGGRTDI